MIPISRLPNDDEKNFGLFPHFCHGSRDILFFRFFLRCTLADFPYAKNDAKNVSIFSSIFFLFVVGGDVLCVKEFKCLFTKHFARA